MGTHIDCSGRSGVRDEALACHHVLGVSLEEGDHVVNRPLVERTEADSPFTKIFDQCDQVRHRPPQTVQSPDNQDIAPLQGIQALG